MEDHVMEGLWNRGCATIFQSLAKVSHNNSVIFITLNTSQGRVCYKVNMHHFHIQRSLHNLVDTFNAVFDQNLLAGMSGPSGVFVSLPVDRVPNKRENDSVYLISQNLSKLIDIV